MSSPESNPKRYKGKYVAAGLGIGVAIAIIIILLGLFGGKQGQTNTVEQIIVTNVHSWVSASNSTSAFAIENIGSKTVTVTDIKLRGIAVPIANWYFCKGACATQSNIETSLPVDFSPATVTIGEKPYAMTNNEEVSLSKGEAAIVYMFNAGNTASVDEGNVYELQIQTGLAKAVVHVQVVKG